MTRSNTKEWTLLSAHFRVTLTTARVTRVVAQGPAVRVRSCTMTYTLSGVWRASTSRMTAGLPRSQMLCRGIGYRVLGHADVPCIFVADLAKHICCSPPICHLPQLSRYLSTSLESYQFDSLIQDSSSISFKGFGTAQGEGYTVYYTMASLRPSLGAFGDIPDAPSLF